MSAKNLDGLAVSLQNALHKVVSGMTLEELQCLDWFTWETDSFLEKKSGPRQHLPQKLQQKRVVEHGELVCGSSLTL